MRESDLIWNQQKEVNARYNRAIFTGWLKGTFFRYNARRPMREFYSNSPLVQTTENLLKGEMFKMQPTSAPVETPVMETPTEEVPVTETPVEVETPASV